MQLLALNIIIKPTINNGLETFIDAVDLRHPLVKQIYEPNLKLLC